LPPNAVASIFLLQPMTLLVLHAAATLFMTGLVWFAQIVHYPLLHRVGASGFSSYETEHTRRTSPIVAPVMLFELGSGVWLALEGVAGVYSPLLLANVVLLAVIWGSTFVLQAPTHRKLALRFSADSVDYLISSNWIRTASWSLRALLVVFILQVLTTPAPPPRQPPPEPVQPVAEPRLPVQGVLLK
jgi:hypothetical protein